MGRAGNKNKEQIRIFVLEERSAQWLNYDLLLSVILPPPETALHMCCVLPSPLALLIVNILLCSVTLSCRAG
jgi:hypothetical protein